MKIEKSDFLIIGAGIIGLAIARRLNEKFPGKLITIIDKEIDVAKHGSGRNSGVLHAGFYYTSSSLKAKFTAEGNRALRAYCEQNRLAINENKKVVVTQHEGELSGLQELARRGAANGVEVRLIDAKELKDIEPNAKTIEQALYSPTTATVDPVAISQCLRKELSSRGIKFFFETSYERRLDGNTIIAGGKHFEASRIINAAGLYADKIAKDFGFSQKYSIVPFKGIYLKYTKPDKPIRTNIYPVPNLNNPFLGVHYTITVDGQIKIGPTAIPAFWRENYHGLQNFKFGEFLEILKLEGNLFRTNAFKFRELAFEEMKKYRKSFFVELAKNMVHSIDSSGFTEWSKPGIRAQLLNLETFELVQDFVVEGDKSSTHVLNAVSPAFTSSFPFANWVIEQYLN